MNELWVRLAIAIVEAIAKALSVKIIVCGKDVKLDDASEAKSNET